MAKKPRLNITDTHRQGLWLEPWRERLFQICLVHPTQAIAPHVSEKIVTDFLLFQCIFKAFTLTITPLTGCIGHIMTWMHINCILVGQIFNDDVHNRFRSPVWVHN